MHGHIKIISESERESERERVRERERERERERVFFLATKYLHSPGSSSYMSATISDTAVGKSNVRNYPACPIPISHSKVARHSLCFSIDLCIPLLVGPDNEKVQSMQS